MPAGVSMEGKGGWGGASDALHLPQPLCALTTQLAPEAAGQQVHDLLGARRHHRRQLGS